MPRQRVQTAISDDENSPKTDFVLQINTHAFNLCTEFLKVLEMVNFKKCEGSLQKTIWAKLSISSCHSLADEKWEFILSLTQRHHVRNNTFHMYLLRHHWNCKN